MNYNLLNSIYELKDALANDSANLKLDALEKSMMADLHFCELVKQKEDIIARIEDDSKIERQKEILKIEKTISSLPVVQNYLKQYKEVSKIYREISKALFYPIIGENTFMKECLRNDKD